MKVLKRSKQKNYREKEQLTEQNKHPHAKHNPETPYLNQASSSMAKGSSNHPQNTIVEPEMGKPLEVQEQGIKWRRKTKTTIARNPPVWSIQSH
jgi:hypothetical protein